MVKVYNLISVGLFHKVVVRKCSDKRDQFNDKIKYQLNVYVAIFMYHLSIIFDLRLILTCFNLSFK